MGFILREFIWDIPVLLFAYVLFLGPYSGRSGGSTQTLNLGTLTLNQVIMHPKDQKPVGPNPGPVSCTLNPKPCTPQLLSS